MTQGGAKKRKQFILPDFTQPVLSITSVPPSLADKGCRLEPNNSYIRYWEKGRISSDPVTSPLTVNYAFPSASDGWAAMSSLPQGMSLIWQSGDGHAANGCLQIGSDGSGSGIATGYWNLATTWSGLGVPAGKSVTNISFSIWDRIGGAGTSSTYTLGPYDLYDSANTTLIATLINSRSVGPGTTSFSQVNSGSVLIPSVYQSASTTVTFRLSASVNTSDSTNNARFDDISIVITFV